MPNPPRGSGAVPASVMARGQSGGLAHRQFCSWGRAPPSSCSVTQAPTGLRPNHLPLSNSRSLRKTPAGGNLTRWGIRHVPGYAGSSCTEHPLGLKHVPSGFPSFSSHRCTLCPSLWGDGATRDHQARPHRGSLASGVSPAPAAGVQQCRRPVPASCGWGWLRSRGRRDVVAVLPAGTAAAEHGEVREEERTSCHSAPQGCPDPGQGAALGHSDRRRGEDAVLGCRDGGRFPCPPFPGVSTPVTALGWTSPCTGTAAHRVPCSRCCG